MLVRSQGVTQNYQADYSKQSFHRTVLLLGPLAPVCVCGSTVERKPLIACNCQACE